MTEYRLFRCLVCGFEYDEAQAGQRKASIPAPCGRHPRRLVVPRLRRREGRFRHDRDRPAMSCAF